MSKGKRIVIVGGVAGGASSATRARRLSEDAEIIIFERGQHVSFANCGLPYHISGVIPHRKSLHVQTQGELNKRFNIDVRTRTEVIKINPKAKVVIARNLDSGDEEEVPYDKLILSPGAEPIRPPIPGVDLKRVFTLRTIPDMEAIINLIEKEKLANAAIVGGGYIGLEVAEALRGRGLDVSIIELTSQVMPPADPEMATILHKELRRAGVDLRLKTSVTGFKEKDGALEVELSSGETISCGFAIISVGIKPEVELARKAGIEIGQRGGIVVDKHMRTSDPNIFAVGDAVEAKDFITGTLALIPLAGPANRQGRIAADNAFGRDSTYKDTQGTAICKLFDLAIGLTGASEKSLKKAGISYQKIYVHPSSHAGYYPGAEIISLKLLFSPEDGRILGAQAVGADGVDKRIDVLAIAIRAGLTVFDLEETELAYAPPYGSAKDPINFAGFVASNVLRGDVKICDPEEVINLKSEQIILDVRGPVELEARKIEGVLNISLNNLRSRLDEVPRDKELLVLCATGFQSYIACRMLAQHGFKCRNINGGFRTYSAVADSLLGPLA